MLIYNSYISSARLKWRHLLFLFTLFCFDPNINSMESTTLVSKWNLNKIWIYFLLFCQKLLQFLFHFKSRTFNYILYHAFTLLVTLLMNDIDIHKWNLWPFWSVNCLVENPWIQKMCLNFFLSNKWIKMFSLEKTIAIQKKRKIVFVIVHYTFFSIFLCLVMCQSLLVMLIKWGALQVLLFFFGYN
jgi:hypothetical protein